MSGKSIRWAYNFVAWKPTKEEWLLATSCIQAEEKSRIERFVYAKDAKSSMVGRLLLRKCISETLGFPYDALRLGRSENFRPVIVYPDNIECTFDFNVSHEGDFSVLAADSYPKVGVDIMKMQYLGGRSIADFFSLMRRQFTPNEWNFVEQSRTEEGMFRRFYRLWSLKESFVKAEGVGLGINLQRLNFVCKTQEVQEGSITKDTKLYFDGRLLSDWIFQETLLNGNHCVCTAIYCEDRNRLPEDTLFRTLTFQELVQGAQPLNASCVRDWALFDAKEERRA